MTDAHGRSDHPTPFELLECVLLSVAGAVLAGPMLPGFTLCVAGLILLAVVVIAPIRSHRGAPSPEAAASPSLG